MRFRSLPPVLIALALLASRPARADEKADLEKGRNAYLTKDFTEADARFRAMLDPAIGSLKSPELINEARMLWGAVYIAMKRTDDAQALFAKVLRQDPEYQPDPLAFGTDVLDRFTDTKAKLKDEINAIKQQELLEAAAKRTRDAAEKKKQQDRIELLEKLSGQETVVERHSRFIGLLPLGAGQFQNGRPGLGAFFLLSQGVFFLASAVSTGIGIVFQNQAHDAINGRTPTIANTNASRDDNAGAQVCAYVDWGTVGAFGVLWIASVIEAQAHYLAEVTTTRRRALPVAWLTPLIQYQPEHGELSGGGVSLNGSF